MIITTLFDLTLVAFLADHSWMMREITLDEARRCCYEIAEFAHRLQVSSYMPNNLGPCKGNNTCLLIQLAWEDLVTVKGGINAIEWLVPYVHESEVYKRLTPL